MREAYEGLPKYIRTCIFIRRMNLATVLGRGRIKGQKEVLPHNGYVPMRYRGCIQLWLN